MRECRTCGTQKPIDDKWHGRQCRSCYLKEQSERTKRWRDANPDWVAKRNRRARFTQHGITEEIFNSKLEEQGGGCLLCDSKENLHIDHDHEHCPGQYGCSECFRSILCSRCNMGIGLFLENPALLRKAAQYVERVL